jgi:hypothetical protein
MLRSIAVEIMEEYDIQDEYFDEVKEFLRACEKYGINENPKIWNEKLLKFCRYCNPSQMQLAMINLMYHRECKSTELAKLSVQSAKPVEILRNMGFQFESVETASGPQYVKNNMRTITGFHRVKRNKFTKASKDRLAKFREQAGRDPLTMSHRNLQIDHRTPVIACKKLGINPVSLTNALIDSGEAGKYFQVFSVSTNSLKREVCKKCLNGGDIELPAAVHQGIYKKCWDKECEENKSCVGCFYYDYRIPRFAQR